MPYFQCADLYPFWFNDSNLCVMGAGGRSTCSGDSGGPLTVISHIQSDWMLVSAESCLPASHDWVITSWVHTSNFYVIGVGGRSTCSCDNIEPQELSGYVDSPPIKEK